MKHVGRSEFFEMESTWAKKVSFYVVDLGQKSCYVNISLSSIILAKQFFFK